MTQHSAKLTGGPLDGQIRSLVADSSLDGDKEERGNPQLVISYEQVNSRTRKLTKGMYLRRRLPGDDGVWEYLHVPPPNSKGIQIDGD